MHSYNSLEKKIAKMRELVAPYGKRLAMTEGHYGLAGRNRCEVLSSWAAALRSVSDWVVFLPLSRSNSSAISRSTFRSLVKQEMRSGISVSRL